MAIDQLRGGVPSYRTLAIDTTGRRVAMIMSQNTYPTNIFFLIIRNKGNADVRLYFTEADFDADAGAALPEGHFVEIGGVGATAPYGEWKGPVGLDDNECAIWLRSTGGTQSMEVVGFQRLG